MRVRAAYGLMFALTMTSGCAVQRHLEALEREQRQTRAELEETRKNLAEVGRTVRSLSARLDSLRGTRGGREGAEQRLGAVQEREDTGTRERGEVDSGDSATLPSNVRGAPAPTPITPARRDLDVAALEQEESREAPDEFRRGLAFVREGAYDRAIQTMRNFLRTGQDPRLAASAHYWMGESYFQLGQYYPAVLSFTEVHQRYPRSDHAAAAVLKTGLVFLQLGNSSEARRAFERVLSEYPSAPEATRAAERLRDLGNSP